MKIAVSSFILLSVLASADAAIEFVGRMASDKATTFAVVNTVDGRTGWITIGQCFDGYRLVDYSHETETLTLTREEELLKVPLKAASFTIPTEVTGMERERQFARKLNEMRLKPGQNAIRNYAEDYMATASQFGREIISYDVKDGMEVIVMELPEALRPLPGQDGAVVKVAFQITMLCRDKKTKMRITIH